MIYYDSHKWRTLAKVRGSVLPKAMLWAMPSAIVACTLKYLEQEGFVSLDRLNVLLQGDIYSGFTYVLGFSLVFRTSQSYLRYWTAATSVHEMSSEWSDSCASLIAFATVSRAPYKDIQRFNHTVVRLFSLLHATALSEIASISEELPLIDVQGLSKDELLALTSSHAQGRKVQIVLCWIKTYIIQMADQGLLNVPAPILTRVFQELGAGLVNFHKSQQIVIWPFPFPYTQLNLLLIQVYTIITPLVVTTWETWAWMCFAFTFISVTCMMGLDLIASELENPFGDDPNDLPVLELQGDMNKFLTFQLAPVTHRPPALLPSAMMDYKTLIKECSDINPAGTVGKARLQRSNSLVETTKTVRDAMKRADKYQAQMRWAGDTAPAEELTNLQRWLRCLPSGTTRMLTFVEKGDTGPSPGAAHHVGFTIPGSERTDSLHSLQSESETSSIVAEKRMSNVMTEKSMQSVVETKAQDPAFADVPPYVSERPVVPLCSTGDMTASQEARSWRGESQRTVDFSPFLTALHKEFREHMDNQLEVQKQELTAIEGLLTRLRSPSHEDQCSRAMSDMRSDVDSEPEKSAYLPAPLPRPVLFEMGSPLPKEDVRLPKSLPQHQDCVKREML